MTEQEKTEEMYQLPWRQVLHYMRLLDEENKRKREIMRQALEILKQDREKWGRINLPMEEDFREHCDREILHLDYVIDFFKNTWGQ